ncbi:MAG TPA: biopolymer transporter ExbD [Polyangia bacterium]|jgi:biopolymer transport protein ExbD
MVSGESDYDVPLNLVALIDILTNILFFLLVSYASQELQLQQAANVKLPSSYVSQQLKMATMVSLSDQELKVEQVTIAKVGKGKIDAPMEGDKIVPLYNKLNTLRAMRRSATRGPSENDDVVLLLCDKQVPFAMLSKVLRTAAMAGYPNFRFAVMRK